MRIATLVKALVAAGLPLFVAVSSAEASYSVNGLGNGTATASIWVHPNAPPAPPTASSTVSGFVPTTGFNPPPVPGSNPLTTVFVSAGSFWRANTVATAAGGDTVAWDHSLDVITPTSPVASTNLVVDSVMISPTTVNFVISWSGTDAGTAQHLQWFDVTSPGSPILLGDEFRVGPWSETFTRTITMPGLLPDGSNLLMASDGAATSLLPEPMTLTVVFGAAALFVRRPSKSNT